MALVVGLFALLTGVAVLFVGAMLPDLASRPVEVSAGGATRAAADQFYAAQDSALATGDPYLLIAAVDPAFVGHRPGLAAALDRTGLVDEVTALRSAQPSVRLAADTLLVDGDRALVYVSRHPAAPLGQDEVTATLERVAGDTIEVVRVAGGVVAEHWSLATAPETGPPTMAIPTAVPYESSEGLVCLASGCH